MYAIKRYSIWHKTYPEDLVGPVFSETFMKTVAHNGRSYEPILATSYVFGFSAKEFFKEVQGATKMMLKGRIPVLPSRIKHLKNFQKMINRIVSVGEEA